MINLNMVRFYVLKLLNGPSYSWLMMVKFCKKNKYILKLVLTLINKINLIQ